MLVIAWFGNRIIKKIKKRRDRNKKIDLLIDVAPIHHYNLMETLNDHKTQLDIIFDEIENLKNKKKK